MLYEFYVEDPKIPAGSVQESLRSLIEQHVPKALSVQAPAGSSWALETHKKDDNILVFKEIKEDGDEGIVGHVNLNVNLITTREKALAVFISKLLIENEIAHRSVC